MKNALLNLSLALALITSTTTLNAQNVTPQQEGPIFSIEVANIVFKVDTVHGAKASSLTIGGEEFMVTADMVSSDFLWGSTLWPAPQNEWGWNNPNKYIWDNQEYTSSIEADTMSFTGKEASVDNGDSFYFIKKHWASVKDSTLHMHYSMVNTTGKSIKKGLWELTRVPVGGLTFWPTGPGGTWGDLAPATEDLNGHTWYLRESEDGTNLKFFADGSEGWFAHADMQGRLFIKTFNDVNQADFASGEGEIELWVADEYIELENQSVCRDIPDGGMLSYKVEWYLRELPESIEVYAGNSELVDYVKWVISEKPDPSGISEKDAIAQIHIYPNPARDVLHVVHEAFEKADCRYSIINILGKKVMQGELSPKSIDVSALDSGIYCLRLRNGQQVYTRKFRIE